MIALVRKYGYVYVLSIVSSASLVILIYIEYFQSFGPSFKRVLLLVFEFCFAAVPCEKILFRQLFEDSKNPGFLGFYGFSAQPVLFFDPALSRLALVPADK
jgi:hypothetical protein